MTKTILQQCINIVKDFVGYDYLYFNDAVEIKLTPHTYQFNAWAVSVSPAEEFYVMDSNEQWYKIEPDENNATLVIGSLYQRLKLMRIKYAKAS